MPPTQPTAVLDRTEAERLARPSTGASRRLTRPTTCSPPMSFFDSFPPQWRFQLQGRSALRPNCGP